MLPPPGSTTSAPVATDDTVVGLVAARAPGGSCADLATRTGVATARAFVGTKQVESGVRAFYLGDVCGDDVAAAAAAAVVRRTLRSAVLRTRDPAAAIEHLQAALARDADRSDVTAIVGFARRSSDGVVVEFAIAGHPRPVVIGPYGTFEFGRSGPVLGTLGCSPHPVNVVRLGRRQQLILYTEGLTRASTGERAVLDVLDGIGPDQSADATADVVFARAAAGLGPTDQDDVAVLVLGVAGDLLP